MKKMELHPHSIQDTEAPLYYDGFPESFQKRMSLDKFKEEFIRILKETGDLDNGASATKQGEEHGLFNKLAGGYTEKFHYTTSIVIVNKEGKEYLKKVMMDHFPEFDEQKYYENRKKTERAHRQFSQMLFKREEYGALSARVLNFAGDLAAGEYEEWAPNLIYLCMEEQYVGPFLKVFPGMIWAEGSSEGRKESVMMSGSQVELAFKNQAYVDGTDSDLARTFCTGVDHDNIIYHFEEIVSVEAQEFLADCIESATVTFFSSDKNHKDARFILISRYMPYEYHIENDYLRQLILSAPAFDLRSTGPFDKKLNDVTLKGRITKGPRPFTSPSKTPGLVFGLTVLQDEFNANSELQQIDCTVNYSKAKYVEHFLKKNDVVVVVGKLHVHRWTSGSETRSQVEIICDNVYAVPEAVEDTERKKDN